MTAPLLPEVTVDEAVHRTRQALDPATLAAAGEIVDEVRRGGRNALVALGVRFGDLEPGAPLLYTPDDLRAALGRLPDGQRGLLERTADRIRRFAEAQRACLRDLDLPIEGGRAGWRFQPVHRAGCYAPGGRFPLPSSVLMTAVTARTAGVADVWVASPGPGDLTLAAAAVAGADALLAVGGAQAVAAMACGVDGVPACDVIVGPGNRFVTAAKQLVSGQVGIDMLAGPSELLVLADRSADPAVVAADLIAQAEHDPDAVPLLLTLAPDLPEAVNQVLAAQLGDLPTAGIARTALANGGWIPAGSLEEAVIACNRIAPEHLEVMIADPGAVTDRLTRYGALFLGARTAEVLGDYGAGPNHVLPTGGTGRFSGGLSVQDFLVGRTWLDMDDGEEAAAVARDAVDLARLEGLEGHARSAARRLPPGQRLSR